MDRLTRQRNTTAGTARGFHSRRRSATVPCMYGQYTPRCTRQGVDGQRCSETAAEWPVLPCCPLPVVACWAHLSADEAEHCHAIRDASGRWLWTGDAGDEPDAPTASMFRNTWTSAYDPWPSEDDARLRVLWDQGVGLTDIAEALARHPETIRARLALLGVAGMPASTTAFAMSTYMQRPPAPTPRVAVAPAPPQRQPSPYELLDSAGVPWHLRSRPWVELAALVECGSCFADPGAPCTGHDAIDMGRGVVICPARFDEIPEVKPDQCPRCAKPCMDRPAGWHDTCWNHSSKEDKVAFASERTQVWDNGYRSYKKMLNIDVATADQFGCMECGVTPGVPCREPQRYGPADKPNPPDEGLSHFARIRVAQSHRRTRIFLEGQEPALPFP